MLAYSTGFTFLIVSLYETLDLISVCKKVMNDVSDKFWVGMFTLVAAVVFLLLGFLYIENEFYKNVAITFGGNLIGYALVLIIVVKMKDSFKKWQEEKAEIEKQKNGIEREQQPHKEISCCDKFCCCFRN